MIQVVLLLLVSLVASPGFVRAQAVVPGGGSLLAWLGHEPGERQTYVTDSGERVCVEVGGPIRLKGERYVPLLNLPWPGLASDAQVFVPLDGTLGIGVLRGLVLDPDAAFDWLLAPLPPRFIQRAALAHPGAVGGDGWYAIGDSASDPTALLYVWCHACSDAGTYVWMERGRGITRIEERTIAGPRRVELLGDGCEKPVDARSMCY